MNSILRRHDSVKGLRAPQSLRFHSQTGLMFGIRDSVTSFHSQTSLMFGVRDSSVAPSSRDSIGMTGFVGLEGVQICWSGASANFYPCSRLPDCHSDQRWKSMIFAGRGISLVLILNEFNTAKTWFRQKPESSSSPRVLGTPSEWQASWGWRG